MFTNCCFSEQNSFFSSNNFLIESDDEFAIIRDPFNLIEPDNSLLFDNMNCFLKNENTFEFSKDEAQEKEKNDLKNNNSNSLQKKLSGRKRKNSLDNNGKFHNKSQNDNILRKINVHFLNFIIDFINEVLCKCDIKTKNINDKFYEINGKYKKIINKTNFNFISNQTISQILTLENNNKYINKNQNRELLDKIKNSNNEILNKILSKKYIDIFKEVFYINKKEIFYEGLVLNLPKTFDDFLINVKANDDTVYKMRIEEVIKKYYFPQKFNVKKTKAFISKL